MIRLSDVAQAHYEAEFWRRMAARVRRTRAALSGANLRGDHRLLTEILASSAPIWRPPVHVPPGWAEWSAHANEVT